MIGFWKIVFLIILASYVDGKLEQNIPKCPEVNSISHTLHLPHATNCTLFYRCDHGTAKLEHCPGGLHFNPNLQVCDWPSNANCVAETTTTVKPTTATSQTTSTGITENVTEGTTGLENSSTTESNGSNISTSTTYSSTIDISTTTPIPSSCSVEDTTDTVIRLPHETNCRFYYICRNGKATLYQCKSGQHFSPVLRYCLPESEARCQTSSTPISSTSSLTDGTSEQTTTYVSTSENTSETNIDETTDGVGVTTEFPENSIEVTSDADTTFSSTDPTNESTVVVTTSDDTVETTEDITSSTDTSSTVTPKPLVCPLVDEPGVVVRLAHETNCRYYYICKKGTPKLYQCKSGQHFSLYWNYCRVESEAGCSLFSSTDIPTTQPTVMTTSAATTVEESSETNIDESNEATDETNTSGSSEFTDGTNQSSTESSNTSDSDDTTNESISYQCPAIDEPGVVVRLPHELNCRYYYICNNGSRSLFQCYGGQHFSPTQRVCTPEDEAGCSLITSTATTPSTKPTEESTEEVSLDTTPDLNETTVNSSSEDPSETTAESTTEDVTDNEFTESTTLELSESTSISYVEETSEDSEVDNEVDSTTSAQPKCPLIDDPNVIVRLPHATNCSWYYMCKNGKTSLFQCYKGEHFSPSLRVCMPENEAGCI